MDKAGSYIPQEIMKIMDSVLKAVALGLGIAVTVMSLMDRLETNAALSMLGLGLAYLAIPQLPGSAGEEEAVE